MGALDGIDVGPIGDVQWLAVRAGLKPACRQLFGGRALQEALARAARHDLHVECLPAAEYVAGWSDPDSCPGDTLIFVARNRADARRALEAERDLFTFQFPRTSPPSILKRLASIDARERNLRRETELGLALGYPPCCVEFFCPRTWWPMDRLRLIAMAQTEGIPSLVLNNMDFNDAIIPHFVCRYDCPQSTAYAEALLAEIAKVNRAATEAARKALRGTAILFREWGHLWLADAVPADGRSPYSAVKWSGDWPDRQRWIDAAQQASDVAVDEASVRFLRADDTVAVLPLPPTSGVAGTFGTINDAT